MVIFDKDQLKNLATIINNLVMNPAGHTLSLNKSLELTARLTNSNSYSHFCKRIKEGPVTALSKYITESFTEYLSDKHKIKLSEVELGLLRDTLKTMHFPLIPTPDFGKPYRNAEPFLLGALNRSTEYLNYITTDLPTAEEEAFVLRLFGTDTPETVEDCNELIEDGFMEYYRQDIYPGTGDFDSMFDKWMSSNKSYVKKVKYHAKSQFPYLPHLLSQGANLEFTSFRLRQCLPQHKQEGAYIGIWKYTDIEMSSMAEANFTGKDFGHINAWIGLFEDGSWRKIGESKGLIIDIKSTPENDYKKQSANHSSIMKGTCQAVHNFLDRNNYSYSDLQSTNGATSILRLTSVEMDREYKELMFLLVAYMTEQSTFPGSLGRYPAKYAETLGLPFYSHVSLVLCELRGSLPASDYPANYFAPAIDHSGTKISSEEKAYRKTQKEIYNQLQSLIGTGSEKSSLHVIGYEPVLDVQEDHESIIDQMSDELVMVAHGVMIQIVNGQAPTASPDFLEDLINIGLIRKEYDGSYSDTDLWFKEAVGIIEQSDHLTDLHLDDIFADAIGASEQKK